MKILTTGGSGFAGKYLLRALVEQGYDVINLVNKNFSGIHGVKEIRIKNFEPEYLKGLLDGIDIIVHLAAALGSTKANYDYFYKVNSLFPENLIKAAVEKGVKKFIYISSAGVYGKGSKKIIDEKFPPSPIDEYEKTKFSGEKNILKFKGKINVVIVRPGWIYGPGDKRTLKLYRAINYGKFFVAGKGDGFQTPVFVEDFVKAIILIIKNNVGSGEIFNIAGKELLRTEDMIRIIATQLKKRILPFKIPILPLKLIAKILDLLSSITGINFPLTSSSLAFFERSKPLSIEKAKNVLKFTPETDFEEGIRLTLNWYKKEGLL